MSFRLVCASTLLAVGLAGVSPAHGQSEFPFLQRPVVCFPPSVPIFGEEIVNQVPRGPDAARMRPPGPLADYVGEYFYPALSTRLIDQGLGKKFEARLEAYFATRSALLNELADQLVALNQVDDETRTVRLRSFAQEQNPKIAVLEREAEELREVLIDGRILQRSVDWSRDRPWAVGVTRFGNDLFAREAEFQVVRAAAFYQDGLIAEQRGLLLEAAAELRQRARAARPIPPPRRDEASAMFFSPATSRLRLPPKMSHELSGKVGRYNQLKLALKQELVQTVLGHDNRQVTDRTAVFSALADAQWPKFAELEELAEQIRAELAALPPVKLSAPPYIPGALIQRLEGYMRERKRVIAEFEQTMRTAAQMMPPLRLEPGLTPEERAQRVREHERERGALRERISAAFHEAARERIEDLRRRYDRIQEDLTLLASGQLDPETGRPLDADGLLRVYSVAQERFATFGREEVIYRGYRTAMLMPGLSREQRRLLFAAAVRGLAQPLPWGELIPTEALPVPRS